MGGKGLRGETTGRENDLGEGGTTETGIETGIGIGLALAIGGEMTAEMTGETTEETTEEIATAETPKIAPPSRRRSLLRPRLLQRLAANL